MRIINPYNTVLIFDWDDTLLPINWLHTKGVRQDQPINITEDIAVELEILDEMCFQVLNQF